MQAQQLLHKVLKKTLPTVHVKRFNALSNAVEALLIGKRLTLSLLGRHLRTQAKERHAIRMLDRLLGNPKLHQERLDFYQSVATLYLTGNRSPLVSVDWSCVNKNKDWHMLRASINVKGRGMTLYQEIHPRGSENNPKIEKKFLEQLKKVLPANTIPIIITDAGFRCPWFRAVEALGFDWIGRIRNNNYYRIQGEAHWHSIYDLYEKAKKKAQYCGEVSLTKTHALICSMVLYKKAVVGRTQRTRRGRKSQSSDSLRCAKRHREPWLLATSLNIKEIGVQKIVAMYAKRMQIEENFRDTKSHQFGFGLRYSQSKSAQRLQILLLIGDLAALVCWLMALTAQKLNMHWDFQANTIKSRTVLSVIYLGCQLIRKRIRFKVNDLMGALKHLKLLITEAAAC